MSTRAYPVYNNVIDELIIAKTLNDTFMFDVTKIKKFLNCSALCSDNALMFCIGENSMLEYFWCHILNKLHKNHDTIYKITEDFQNDDFVSYECH